jgi:hypothetical protein
MSGSANYTTPRRDHKGRILTKKENDDQEQQEFIARKRDALAHLGAAIERRARF